MINLFRQKISPALSVIVASFFAIFIINVVWAWTGPTATPPNSNVSAPLNVGLTPQNKSGALGVGAFTSFGDAFFNGNVGIGTANPAYLLDVQGGDLNVSGSLYEAGALLSEKYAKKDGSNVSGTWGINVSGSAASASTANYANSAGSASTANSAGSVGPFSSSGTVSGTTYFCFCAESDGKWSYALPWNTDSGTCSNFCGGACYQHGWYNPSNGSFSIGAHGRGC
jgi:hypothetical protein